MTQVWPLDPQHPDPALLARAGSVLRQGGLVAFPTETVYGLGANALDPQAVARIFTAKGRPAYDPLIVHLASPQDASRVARSVPPLAQHLWARFAPGPLTLLLPRHPALPSAVTAGRDTVAVRIPAHPVALGLIQAAGVPVAAPSANRFGHTSPTTAQHVLADLADRVDVVLDAGPTPIGVESTILDLTTSPPTLLRPGGIAREALEEVLGQRLLLPAAAAEEAPRAPGRLPRHYAPQVPLWLLDGPPDWAREVLRQIAAQHGQAQGQRIGALVPREDSRFLAALGVQVVDLGPESEPARMARDLFAALRALEAAEVNLILARTVSNQGLGLAINDRLRRAATQILRPPRAHAATA